MALQFSGSGQSPIRPVQLPNVRTPIEGVGMLAQQFAQQLQQRRENERLDEALAQAMVGEPPVAPQLADMASASSAEAMAAHERAQQAYDQRRAVATERLAGLPPQIKQQILAEQMTRSLFPEPQGQVLSEQEEARMGLPPEGVWQRDASGRVSQVYMPEAAGAWGDARTVGGALVVPDGSGGVREIYRAPQRQPDQIVVGREESEEAKVVGRAYGELFVSTQDAARAARTQNAQLDELQGAFADLYTGPGGESVQAVRRFLGLFDESLAEDAGRAEAGRALSSRMALEFRNPSGGAGMPGAMSDKDREFLQSMVPGLGNTEAGRRLMVDVYRRLNRRKIDVAEAARQYRSENGRLDEGFYTFLGQRFGNRDLFDDEMRERQANATGGAQQQTPASPPAAGTPPEGISAQEWQYMTPEERALFQ